MHENPSSFIRNDECTTFDKCSPLPARVQLVVDNTRDTWEEKLSPFIKSVKDMDGKEAHAALFALLTKMQKRASHFAPSLQEKVEELLALLTTASAKDQAAGKFGLAISKRLDEVHGLLVNDGPVWTKFRKEMDSVEKRHLNLDILKAKVKTKKDRSGSEPSFRPAERREPPKGKAKLSSPGKRGHRDAGHGRGRTGSPDNNSSDDELAPLRLNYFKYVPEDKRPHSKGCYGCGDRTHVLHQGCPGLQKFKDLVEKHKRRAPK